MINQIQLKESVKNKEKQQSIKNQIFETLKEEKRQFQLKKDSLLQEMDANKKLIENLKIQLPVILEKLYWNGDEQISESFKQKLSNDDVPFCLLQLEHRTNLILKLVKDNNFEKVVFKEYEHKIYQPKEKSKQAILSELEQIKTNH